ncbi:hypothetical protein [Vibrio campbellii]|uniref:hypothetical protein n=1 Tax=Vibrio campbellii TaxID=680 RepID=UPI00168CFA53|nr:hypothetical protein [Vibrio campbellii]
MMSEITIRSESDFLELAKRVLLDNDTSVANIKFDGWPTIEFYIRGERYNQSLPVSAMEGYVGFQQELYRLFTDLKYNQPSLQTLRASDRQDLELVFKVLEGSSDTKAEGWDVLNNFIGSLDTLLAGMDSMEKILFVLSLAGILAGTWCFTAWNTRRSENEQFEQQQETTRHAITSANENVKEVSKLLENVLINHPNVGRTHEQVAEYSDQAFTNLMRRVPDAEYVRSGNNEFQGAEIREFSRRRRSENGQRNERTDDFYIDGIERSNDAEYMTIKTIKVCNDAPIRMKALTSIVGDDLETLLNAFSTGNTVKIRYISSVRGDDEYSAQFNYVVPESNGSDEAPEPQAS